MDTKVFKIKLKYSIAYNNGRFILVAVVSTFFYFFAFIIMNYNIHRTKLNIRRILTN